MKFKIKELFEAEVVVGFNEVTGEAIMHRRFFYAGQTYDAEAIHVNQELHTASIQFEDETTIYGIPTCTFEVVEL